MVSCKKYKAPICFYFQGGHNPEFQYQAECSIYINKCQFWSNKNVIFPVDKHQLRNC